MTEIGMKIYIIRAISLFLAILTAGMIFSFSADTGEESGSLSEEITEKVLDTVGVDKETMPPAQYEEVKIKTEFSIRKLAHFSEYALLGFFFYVFFRTFDKKVWMTLLFTLAVCVPYAMLDEWHQSFVPGRGPGVVDVLIDSLGAFCGALVALGAWILVFHIVKRKRMKNSLIQKTP